MKKSIGIDVSKNKIDLAYEIEDNKFICSTHKNSDKGIAAYIKKNKLTPDNSFFIMEATGTYYYQLAIYLIEHEFETYVVNPLKIKRYAESEMYRAKTDRVDAKIIARYSRRTKLSPFTVKNKAQMKIDCYSRTIGKLKKDITKYSNRIEAYSNYEVEDILDTHKIIIESIKKEIKKLEKAMKILIKQNFKETNKLLQSISGIGPVNASAIIGLFGNFESFENAKQTVAYAGLNPSPYQSGISVKKQSSISKQGNNYIRQLLYMAALTARRKNPQCTALAQRLNMKNKSQRYILTAVAQKLMRQAFSVVKNKQKYQPNYLKTA